MTTRHSDIAVGDWISGTSQLDEKFIGYVDSMLEEHIVKVWISQSDNDDIVGDFVQMKLNKLKKLPDNYRYTKDELNSLMDLALATKDKAWFEDLVSESIMLSLVLPDFNSGMKRNTNETLNMNWRTGANERNL